MKIGRYIWDFGNLWRFQGMFCVSFAYHTTDQIGIFGYQIPCMTLNIKLKLNVDYEIIYILTRLNKLHSRYTALCHKDRGIYGRVNIRY